jgi:DNA-directed RNA polymerase subunit RPC12/RpoP
MSTAYRKCLACGKDFKSTHSGNRRCGECTRKLDNTYAQKIFMSSPDGRKKERRTEY